MQRSRENAVSMFKHIILQANNDELSATELRSNQAADVFRVREIQRSVDLVKNV